MAFFSNLGDEKCKQKSLYNQTAHESFTHFIIKPTRPRTRLHMTITTTNTNRQASRNLSRPHMNISYTPHQTEFGIFAIYSIQLWSRVRDSNVLTKCESHIRRDS